VLIFSLSKKLTVGGCPPTVGPTNMQF